jgi:hypothetical protein
VTPGSIPRALLALLTAGLLLAGCAGTDPDATRSSATPTSSPGPSADAAPTSGTAPAGATGQRIEVRAVRGSVSGDTGRVTVPLGTAVTLAVTSDAPDEVHVHGYDLTTALSPGTPSELAFDATLPGVFEVELHESGTVLLFLQVQ